MQYKKVYFIGAGGIGMSALAQYFKDHGVEVSGSDRDASPVTEMLVKKGIAVAIPQKKENVPQDAEVVVYSDAVPEDNPERIAAREYGIPEYSYFKMLGMVSVGHRTVAVAGTHGKTTTTGMLAKILRDAGASPTAIVGSIVRDFESNYLPGRQAGLHGDSDLFVVEACEYRDHVLEIAPKVLVLTNLEWDHTDYFHSLEALQETFRKAIAKIPADGALVTNPSDPNIAPLLASAKCPVIDYTKEPAREIKLPGEFNQANALAAAAAARAAYPTITDAHIASALADFHGTWRRFEFKGRNKHGAVVYDDYAHHPTAILKTLAALRSQTDIVSSGRYGKIIVAFHPHLYSRTKDLLPEFATAFKDADKVFIAPIYAAREVDDGTISNTILAARIKENGIDAVGATFEEIERELEKVESPHVIMTMGAGDIYKIADAIVGSSGI
jgi:UDP-N-acetylmuramate--alanine ligase